MKIMGKKRVSISFNNDGWSGKHVRLIGKNNGCPLVFTATIDDEPINHSNLLQKLIAEFGIAENYKIINFFISNIRFCCDVNLTGDDDFDENGVFIQLSQGMMIKSVVEYGRTATIETAFYPSPETAIAKDFHNPIILLFDAEMFSINLMIEELTLVEVLGWCKKYTVSFNIIATDRNDGIDPSSKKVSELLEFIPLS